MKILMVFFTVFFISACANLIDSKEKPQLYEEKVAGEHSVLASCVFSKLQLDSRSFMRLLQFRNRQYPDINASEILALDTRYLPNMVASYSPTNPDAVLIYEDPTPEILPYAHRSKDNGSVYAFVLMLNGIPGHQLLEVREGQLRVSRLSGSQRLKVRLLGALLLDGSRALPERVACSQRDADNEDDSQSPRMQLHPLERRDRVIT